MRSKEIYLVGNAVSIPDVSSISSHEVSNIITFIGKMDYDPNILAVSHFATNIFPQLRLCIPDLQFFIVGANPTQKVRNLALQPNITVTGFVDSIEPYYQQSTIIVAPMLTGAGIQNKIIQAMAYGCCVVTTSIGAEGIDIHNEELAIFDDTQEMINGILDLLFDINKRKKIGIRAREYIINNLSSNIIAQQFWKFIDMK